MTSETRAPLSFSFLSLKRGEYSLPRIGAGAHATAQRQARRHPVRSFPNLLRRGSPPGTRKMPPTSPPRPAPQSPTKVGQHPTLTSSHPAPMRERAQKQNGTGGSPQLGGL